MIGVSINPGRRPDQPEPNLKEWGDRTTNRPPSTTRSTINTRASLSMNCSRFFTRATTSRKILNATVSAVPVRAPSQRSRSRGSVRAISGKSLSNVGSFTNIRGGHAYPDIVRKSEKKPIRIFLVDGRNDNRGVPGNGNYDQTWDWFYQNVRMKDALTEKGYDVNYSWVSASTVRNTAERYYLR